MCWKPSTILTVSSVEPPSTMMCSIPGYVWLATAFNVSAMVLAELKETVMMEIFGVLGCGLCVVGWELWDEGCGMRDEGCAIWVVGCGLWDVGCALCVVSWELWDEG